METKFKEYCVTFEAVAKAKVYITAKDEEDLNNKIENYRLDYDEFEISDEHEATEVEEE